MKRTKDYRRSVAKTHIAKKKKISKHIYFFDWYKNDNQYSKNKVYCSCGMCRSYNKYLGELDLKSFQEKIGSTDEDIKVRIPNRYTHPESHRNSKGWK